MIEPQLVSVAWLSAGDTSPMRRPAVSPVPIAERVAALADTGYAGFGLIAEDLEIVRDSVGFAALRDMARDAGLSRIDIELLERWWIPRGEPGHSYDVRELLFEAADVLAPNYIKIGSQNGSAFTDPLSVAPALRELTEQAVQHGTRIAIETMPFSAIATVPMGVEIVSAAGHPGAGLVIDAWHIFRAGTSLEELRDGLPAEMIFGVELNDAAPEVIGTLFEDTVERRVLCGEGCFDLPGLIHMLRDKGFDGPWGIEILSESFRKLPVRDALRLAADTTRAIL